VNPIGGGPKKLGWGFTWSPFVDGDRLICLPGGPAGTVAALDKNTGQVIWRSTELKDQAAYTSPMLAEIGGVRQYVVLTNQGVYGVAAEDGKLLWSHIPPSRYSTEVVNSPIVRGDLIYVTIGSGQGCELFRVTRVGDSFQTEQLYNNSNLANHHGNVVLVGDHVYGFGQGRGWVCQDLATGEVAWAERRKLGAGALTSADGHFYCYSEDRGEVVLLEVSPVGWNEAGRFAVPQETQLRKPSGKRWTPPVVANGHLYLRDQDLLFCYDVRGAR
jgi:outer membrane protein assembly factor BamB